jgi:hypothetical protein
MGHPKGWRLLDKAMTEAIASADPESELLAAQPIRKNRPKRERTIRWCPHCNELVAQTAGCVGIPHLIEGRRHKAIRVGAARDLATIRPRMRRVRSGGHCQECAAQYGNYHHPGCRLEACPGCGGAAYRCACC